MLERNGAIHKHSARAEVWRDSERSIVAPEVVECEVLCEAVCVVSHCFNVNN